MGVHRIVYIEFCFTWDHITQTIFFEAHEHPNYYLKEYKFWRVRIFYETIVIWRYDRLTNLSGEEIALANENVRRAVYELGVPRDIEPFMNMAFVSLPVIPSLKMTTQGLVNVDKQERISLYCD